MSPYRVLARSEDGKHLVLAAMLSVDKKSQERRIFIVEKVVPIWGQEPKKERVEELADIAHAMVTRKNSSILAQYKIIKTEQMTKPYKVSRVTFSKTLYILSGMQYLQSGCLVAAMEDFCIRAGFDILYQF